MRADSTFVAAVAPCINKLVIAIHAYDFAVICTFLAYHFAGREIYIVDIERKGLSLCFWSIGSEQGSSESTHKMSIGIDQDLLSKSFFEEMDNTDVFAYAALKHNR